MHDFFEPQEESEFISKYELPSRRKAKSRRRWLMPLIILASIMALLMIAFIMIKVLPSVEIKFKRGPAQKTEVTSKLQGARQKDKKVKAKDAKEVTNQSARLAGLKPIEDLLIIGSEEKDGRKRAKGLLLARIDLVNGAIQAINIPERTYLNISGLGLDEIGASFSQGIDSTKRAVKDLLQMQVDDYIAVAYEDFENLINQNRFQIAFNKAIATNFTESERISYSKEISKISLAKVNVVPLPVKFISINGEPYYEPNSTEIANLLNSLWGIKVEIKSATVRVIILNGSGLPGAGRMVADRLKPNGFVVVDTRNASSFNYQTTRIIAYKEEYLDRARAAQQILGVGDVVYHSVSQQDVAEIAIIVGRDFRPVELNN
ncbi:MAG: LytR C-terminal domain-containing protein [Actinomycetota bacterium]|nr:LytR C-terminal domain-containing protein [Actinomycetota bacterium]